MRSPSGTRRRFLRSMTWARIASRIASYCDSGLTSVRVILSIPPSLRFLRLVGGLQHLHRVHRPHAGGLFDLDAREGAVGGDQGRLGFAHVLEEAPPDLQGELEVLLLRAPGAVVPG